MVLAGCWPNNALGEAKLAYCFSAGHLLDSAFVLQLHPRYLCVLESASVRSWALNRLFTNVHTTRYPESRIRHPYTHKEYGVHFRKSGNSCGALLRGNESSSAYPLMTLPVRRAVIRPSFASIADALREEFANKGLRLYENIYIDYNVLCLSCSMCFQLYPCTCLHSSMLFPVWCSALILTDCLSNALTPSICSMVTSLMDAMSYMRIWL